MGLAISYKSWYMTVPLVQNYRYVLHEVSSFRDWVLAVMQEIMDPTTKPTTVYARDYNRQDMSIHVHVLHQIPTVKVRYQALCTPNCLAWRWSCCMVVKIHSHSEHKSIYHNNS